MSATEITATGHPADSRVTGAEYVEAMNRDPLDREYRRAFQRLALTLAPARGRLFDFGCGPGLDAKCYAHAGLTVSGFDVDPAMREYFMRHCETEIAAGLVQLLPGTYGDFLGADPRETPPLDLVTANFAPLNLVTDLPPLFARCAGLLKSDGRLLASVLNPYFEGLWKSRKWWLRAPRLAVEGRYTTQLHGIVPVTRWLPGRLARQAASHFTLASIYTPDTAAPGELPVRVRLANSRDWRRIAATQFLFLVFAPRRDA